MSGNSSINAACSDSGLADALTSGPVFQLALEPRVEDLLHFPVRSELADLAIIGPRLDVHGRHVVCIAPPCAIPMWIAAVKRVPVPVVRRDIPACWIGARLAGVGGIDGFHVGTSDVRMYRDAFFILRAHPCSAHPRDLLGLGLPAEMGEVLDDDRVWTLRRGPRDAAQSPRPVPFSVDDLFDRCTRDGLEMGLGPPESGLLLLRSKVVPSDEPGPLGAGVLLRQRPEPVPGFTDFVPAFGHGNEGRAVTGTVVDSGVVGAHFGDAPIERHGWTGGRRKCGYIVDDMNEGAMVLVIEHYPDVPRYAGDAGHRKNDAAAWSAPHDPDVLTERRRSARLLYVRR